MLGIPRVKHYSNVKQTRLTLILQPPTGPRYGSLFDKLSKITPHRWLHKILSGLSKIKSKIDLTQMSHIKTSPVTFIRPSSVLVQLLRLRLYQSGVLKLALELPLYLCLSLYTLGWMRINTKVSSLFSYRLYNRMSGKLFVEFVDGEGKKRVLRTPKSERKPFLVGTEQC